MNVPTDVAKQVVESLRGTPFVLALVIINIVALIGFGIVLNHVASAMERREVLLKACIERN
jgi:hypothetical protein